MRSSATPKWSLSSLRTNSAPTITALARARDSGKKRSITLSRSAGWALGKRIQEMSWALITSGPSNFQAR